MHFGISMCHGILCFLLNKYWQSLLIQRNNHIVSGFIDSGAKTNVTEFYPMSSRTRIDVT